MDKAKILKGIAAMKSTGDLLEVLNAIKREMSEEKDDKFYPISYDTLCYYSAPNRTKAYYKTFRIPKKTGGFREIASPMVGLKDIQRQLCVLLQLAYSPKENAKGFVKGCSILDNANPHIGKNYIFNIDLKDFFPSIDQARVWKKLQLKPLCFSKPVASRIAGLCAMHIQDEEGKDRFVLPQGSPTSPILSNIVCERLDWKLSGLARRFGLTYTRYADDITFSSMHNVYQDSSEFRQELKRIVSAEHFVINQTKTKLQKRGAHQEVTGLTISDKVNVSRKYVREIRSLLYMWEHYGYSTACNSYLTHHVDKGLAAYYDVPLDNILRGKIEFLKMIKGAKNQLYLSLRGRLFRLLGIEVNQKKSIRPTNLATNLIKKSNDYDVIGISKFMGLFDREDGFKLLTHDFATGSNNQSVSQLQENSERLLAYENRKNMIPGSLYSLIRNFITGGTIKNPYWLDYEGKEHKTSYKDWVSLKCHPITVHTEEIDAFKNSIQIRQFKLPILLDKIKSLYPHLAVVYNKRKLIHADFYTNVWMMSKAIGRILKTFAEYQEFPDIKIELISHPEANTILYELHLEQTGSTCLKKIDELRRKIDNGGGDLGSILKLLAGYCHWSIEANWDGDYLRWNILKSEGKNEVEELQQEPKGFTHILTFYKYCEA